HESTGNGLARSSFEELLKEAHSQSQTTSASPQADGAAAGAGPQGHTSSVSTEPRVEGPARSEPSSPRVPNRSVLSKPCIRTVVEVMAAVAEGVHHAHLAGVIHRDLKPSNIMVETGGHAWVLDFG